MLSPRRYIHACAISTMPLRLLAILRDAKFVLALTKSFISISFIERDYQSFTTYDFSTFRRKVLYHVIHSHFGFDDDCFDGELRRFTDFFAQQALGRAYGSVYHLALILRSRDECFTHFFIRGRASLPSYRIIAHH